MQTTLEEYGKRWASATAQSTMKRTAGSPLAGRRERTQMHDAALKMLAYAPQV
ncbi:MAG: hypothetical protein LW650_14815 [Planctomycetaceae bacterium]|jgi:hypothetical protein|nr:hypothetical protein [Phycisphaerales bacterium]MCE2654659.1 hypothetical protein [Planctomycetaceae bacterium]